MNKLIRRGVVLLALIALIAMTLPAAGGREPAADEMPDTIRIALLSPFTGLGSILGEYIQRGAWMAVQEINAAGGIDGRDLDLRIYDTQADASVAATVLRRAINEDRVVAVFGPNMSSAVLGVHRLAEQAKTPMLVGATSPSFRYTEVGNPYLFRLRADDGIKVYLQVKYAIEELGIERPGVIYGSTDYSTASLAVAERAFEEFGVEIVAAEQITEGDADATGQILSLRRAGVDGLIGLTHEPEAAVVVSQMRELEFDIPIIGFSAWGVPAFTNLAGDAAIGVYSVQGFNPNDERPEVRTFVENHAAQYRDRPSDPAQCYYDGIHLLAKAIEQAGTTDGEVLARTLKEIEYHGVQGRMKADEHHNFTDISYISRFDGEDWEIIDILH